MSAQEWISVKHVERGGGATTITVTLVDGHLAAKWSVRTYRTRIKASVIEARNAATAALNELKEATDDGE